MSFLKYVCEVHVLACKLCFQKLCIYNMQKKCIVNRYLNSISSDNLNKRLYFDILKAFDYVPHSLLYKIERAQHLRVDFEMDKVHVGKCVVVSTMTNN